MKTKKFSPIDYVFESHDYKYHVTGGLAADADGGLLEISIQGPPFLKSINFGCIDRDGWILKYYLSKDLFLIEQVCEALGIRY